MNKGWIKLHRALLEWEWYDDNNTFRLFIHCLLRANHADKEWRGKHIKRGSFFTSLDSLASETGLTVRQIRTSLDKLESTGELTSSGQARGRMITVSKYDSYQSDDKLDDSQMTAKRQADDRLATTNKNENNEKNNMPSGITVDFLESIGDYWNQTMSKFAPTVDLVKNTQINKKRWAKIKKIIAFDSNYSDHEYWDGYISRIAVMPELEWQRNNKQLTFDQAFQLDKFERNQGYMKMGAK